MWPDGGEHVAGAPQHNSGHGNGARPHAILPAPPDDGSDAEREDRNPKNETGFRCIPSERGDERLGEITPRVDRPGKNHDDDSGPCQRPSIGECGAVCCHALLLCAGALKDYRHSH